jgi:NtrC-family two-component system response regulator AlgB
LNAVVSEVLPQRCLVVDDEPSICQTIRFALDTEGWSVRSCGDLASGRKMVADEPFDLALIDLRLGRRSGLDLLPVLKAEQPGIPIVIITAYGSIPSAVDAMRRGATNYLPKPFNPMELRRAVAQAMASQTRFRETDLSKALLESRAASMQALMVQIRKVAQSGATTLLLQGETGVGKGVMAKAVHDFSPRREAPFVVVPCPALPPDMLESELFGHVRGAFTGAHRDHQGRIARAEGGTLFLDEVGDLPLSLQTKLLRVLQEREYEPVGDSRTVKTDVRIISATNVDLAEAVQAGRFRQDLYYRLSAVELRVPPLRERKEDLPKLIDTMLQELRHETGRGPKGFSPRALAGLQSYHWPGNLRELRNMLERVCVLGNQDEVRLEDLAGMYSAQRPQDAPAPGAPEELGSMDEVEAVHIRKVMAQTRTLEQAAKVLNMTAVTLWRKRKKYGL